MKTELEMSVSEVKMVCISCRKIVMAKLIKFGDAYIAVCPLCKKLAYNVKFKDSNFEERFFERQVVVKKRIKKKKRRNK